MARLIWTEKAVEDLENIAEYIGTDSEYYAKDFIKRVIEQVEKLVQFPKIGRIVPEVGDENIREIIYHNYRVVYKMMKGAIYIVIISHGSYDLRSRLKDM